MFKTIIAKLTLDPPPDPQQTEAVYRFFITVNPSDVVELDPVLGDCVLHDPLRATTLFQSVSKLIQMTIRLPEVKLYVSLCLL